MNPLIAAAMAGSEAEGTAAILQKITGQLQGMQGPAEKFNEALAVMQIRGSAASTIITTLGNALSRIPIVGPQIQQLAVSFTMLESQLKGFNEFVRGFSPFDSKLLDKAFADLNASFGEQLIPVIRQGTQLVRWFGDTLAGLTPIVRPLIEQGLARLTPLFQTMGDAVRRSIVALTPLTPIIERALNSLGDPKTVKYLEMLGDTLVELTRQAVDFAIGLDEMGLLFNSTGIYMEIFTIHLRNTLDVLKLLGELSPIQQLGRDRKSPEQSIDFKNKSMDKSYQQTSVTSPDALITKMQQAAFGMGTQSVPKKHLDVAEKQTTLLQKLTDIVEQMGRGVEVCADKITIVAEQIGNGVDKAIPSLPSRPQMPSTGIPWLDRQFQ